MGIGKRLKSAREMRNLTQKELAQLLGVTPSAITNYENETSHPKEPIMYKLFDALGVDANYLFQDEMSEKPDNTGLSPREQTHIKKYRALDERGKETIDTLLDMEYNRISPIGKAEKETSATTPTSEKELVRARLEEEAEAFGAMAKELFIEEKKQELKISSAKKLGAS